VIILYQLKKPEVNAILSHLSRQSMFSGKQAEKITQPKLMTIDEIHLINGVTYNNPHKTFMLLLLEGPSMFA
jgi:hypothetical protein